MSELLTSDHAIFIAMVFIAVFLLVSSVIVPTAGNEARMARRMRERVKGALDEGESRGASAVRERYFRTLSSLERRIEQLPAMSWLVVLIEQSGRSVPAYRVVLLMAGLAVAGLLGMLILTRDPFAALLVAVVLGSAPLLRLQYERRRRLDRFEEQLPEALDIMGRAMRAGHPFSESLKLVSEEMADPIGREFGIAFADLNYGVSTKDAFHAMLERVPSISLMAVVTAVLIQRESGGNLVELLDRIAEIVRGRFRFLRRVKTLSAEGRLSGWILTLFPFVMTGVITITSPDYMPLLIKDPTGRMLIMAGFAFIIVGIFWIRNIIRIRV